MELLPLSLHSDIFKIMSCAPTFLFNLNPILSQDVWVRGVIGYQTGRKGRYNLGKFIKEELWEHRHTPIKTNPLSAGFLPKISLASCYTDPTLDQILTHSFF